MNRFWLSLLALLLLERPCEASERLLCQYSNEEGLAKLQIANTEPENETLVRVFRLIAITVEDLAKAEELREDPDVERVEPDFRRTISLPPQKKNIQPNTPAAAHHRSLKESTQYGIELVQADQLFNLADEAPGQINVCVVDTGTQDFHEDLPNSRRHNQTGTDGFRLTSVAGTWDDDGNGHGTHCAGVIGAIGDNDVGVVGVRKNPFLFQFHIAKGLSDAGSGRTSNILSAVQGCRDAGAQVISMSLGGPFFSQLEQEAYRQMYDEGFLVIAAAGNDGNGELSYPASYPSVLSVAAVNSNKKVADFSQYNTQVELSGPGVDVYSTYPGNRYKTLSGTSMATPHVAGVAAEVWSHFPNCTNNQIRNVLIKSADDLGEEGYDIDYGYGLVQAKAAYDLLTLEGCEAGGPVESPLSDSALGGCQQDPLQTKNCTELGLSGTGRDDSNTGVIIGAVIGGLIVVLAFAGGFLWHKRKNEQDELKDTFEDSGVNGNKAEVQESTEHTPKETDEEMPLEGH